MISIESGKKLASLLLKYGNDLYAVIKSKNCDKNIDQAETYGIKKLSSTSIMFIVFGIFSLILTLSGMCTVFYIIQKTRRIEESERLAVCINWIFIFLETI